MTGFRMRGDFNSFANYDTPFHPAGSDSIIFPLGANIGGVAGGAEKYHMIMDSFGKSSCFGAFCNNNNGWAGLLIKGGVTRGLSIYGFISEGLNGAAGNRNNSANIRVENGSPTFFGGWNAYGLGNPAASGRTESAYFDVVGGDPSIWGMCFNRWDGQTEDVPMIAVASGAEVSVMGIKRGDIRSAAPWTKRPWLKNFAGSTVLFNDNSVRVGVTAP
jgi:hypothetical protein